MTPAPRHHGGRKAGAAVGDFGVGWKRVPNKTRIGWEPMQLMRVQRGEQRVMKQAARAEITFTSPRRRQGRLDRPRPASVGGACCSWADQAPQSGARSATVPR